MLEMDVNKKIIEFKQKKCEKDRGKLPIKDFIKNKYEKWKYFCSLPNLKDEEASLNLCYDAIIDNDFMNIYPIIGFSMVNINKISDK